MGKDDHQRASAVNTDNQKSFIFKFHYTMSKGSGHVERTTTVDHLI